MDSPVSGGSETAASSRNDPLRAVPALRAARRPTRRILGSAFIAALLVIALAAATIGRLRERQLDEGLGDLSALDLLVAAQTERGFDRVGAVLDGLADDLHERGVATTEALRQASSDEATNRLLRAKIADLPQLQDLAIVGADGLLIDGSRGYPLAAPVNLGDRDYFLRLRDHPELAHYVGASKLGSDGSATVVIGKRLSAADGAFIGIVVGNVRLRYFEDLYADSLRTIGGAGKTVALWRNDGTLLAHTPGGAAPQALAAAPEDDRPALGGALAAFWTGGAKAPVAIAQRPLERFPLIVETRAPAAVMLAPWGDGEIAAVAGGGALLALIGLTAWLLLRQVAAAALIGEERTRANREAQAREELEQAMAKAETAMREAQQSEARFRDIVEVGSDWIWETDPEHRFTLVAGARGPGVELLGKTRWEQEGADPATSELWRQHKADLDAHRPFRNFRFALRSPTGKAFHVCATGKPVFGDDGGFVGYRGTVTDESELVEARERAQRSDALLRNAIESIREGFVIYDAEDRFVLCNDAYRKMYPENAAGFVPGASYEQIMREALATGRYPDAAGREEQWLAERMRKHREAVESEEVRLADGRWVLRSERSMPDGGVAGLRIDITALKTAEESLRESQVMLSRAQRLSGTGSVVRNLKTQALEWSEEMYHIFGVDRESFTPSTDEFRARVHPEDREMVLSARVMGLQNKPVPPMEFRIIRPDGTIRWVYREVELVRDRAGEPTGVLSTYQDITERREAEARQRELENLLRDAIESISEGFVIYDTDDRLVMCNDAYRQLYPESTELMVPGTRYEEIVRSAVAKGRYPDARGREEEWIADRMRRHTMLEGPREQRLDDGRWLLFSERRMGNGGTAGLRVDITALKAAQESLRESQAMLNRAQRLSSVGSAVRNLRTKAVEWSDEMYRIFGFDPDSDLPEHALFRARIHPEDAERVRSVGEAAARGQSLAPIEFRIVRPEGAVRWIYREVELIRDAASAVNTVLSTYKDITEQRAAEARQRELEILLRDAIESISEGFVIFDAEDRLVLCNEAYRKLYPHIADVMVPGAGFEDILRVSAQRQPQMAVRSRGEEWLAERMRRHRELTEPIETQLEDGRWVMISERRTSSGGTAGLRVDITDLKRIQQSLRASEQRLDRTQQIAHLGTVERDLRSDEVVWSDETYRIFGVNRESYAPSAENLLAVVHPDDRSRVMSVLRREPNQHANSSLKFRITRPNGELRVIFAQADTAHDDSGAPLYVSVAMMDITERELAHDRQIELETQLRHSEKLTALGTLAGGIAHDLNNTLVPIQALSKLAMQELAKDAPGRADLETIHHASLQARDLVRQILAFSRKQVVLDDPTDIAAKIREALQMLRASVPSTIELAERLTAVPTVFADPTQLQQIVVNLVTNGAHAIGDRCGRVTVTLDEVPSEHPETERLIRLSVADTGCGMSEEILHRMFEPFFTTKGVGEGTGLGLSVVHGIVASRGGTIDVKTQLGEGSEFIILLPAKPAARSAAIAAAQVA